MCIDIRLAYSFLCNIIILIIIMRIFLYFVITNCEDKQAVVYFVSSFLMVSASSIDKPIGNG